MFSKSMKFLMIFVVLAFVACSSSSKSVNVDGTYVFDGETFKAALVQIKDPIFENMPKEVLEKTIAGLQEFSFEIAGKEGTARFSGLTVKGSLKFLSNENNVVKYLMTPYDEDKKSDTATLIIKGNKLTIDPNKKEVDKLYFIKKS